MRVEVYVLDWILYYGKVKLYLIAGKMAGGRSWGR